ncbi:MAG: ATP-binding protein [Candidatus Sumerlaeia bacterium]|nr:ATP-binding protein [Candidatus Sumerlaeia bacterium]
MTKPHQLPGDPQAAVTRRTEQYFRRLRFQRKATLLLAVLAPLAVLSLYFHIQFTYTLKTSAKVHLAALAESQRNTIDQYLKERVANIMDLLEDFEDAKAATATMTVCLQRLRRICDSFVDVGLLNAEGIQTSYAGPFPDLQGRDYSREAWFRSLVEGDSEYHISDIYLGFRNKPHFTVAAKRLKESRLLVARATLDPEKFYLFLRSIGYGRGTDTAILNKEGLYQAVDPKRGELLAPAGYRPPADKAVGAHEIRANGDSIVTAYAWFQRVPWVLVVSQPFRLAYAEMYHVRRIMMTMTAMIVLIAGVGIWLTTDRLLRRAQATAESREALRWQLFHASKLAAIGELAAGVAHEINNPLAAIAATTGLLRDMLDPRFGLEWSREETLKQLDEIDAMVYRARGIITQLMGFARKSQPTLVPCNINDILDGVVRGLKEHEFLLSGIQLVRDYQHDLPTILADPDRLSQVFLNLINNAGDAVKESGTIPLTTRFTDDCIRASVADTGSGIPPEMMDKIFLPFYTTKEVGKGTGLGLSISASIVESMNGRIEVQSQPGAGSTFTVVLPLHPERDSLTRAEKPLKVFGA